MFLEKKLLTHSQIYGILDNFRADKLIILPTKDTCNATCTDLMSEIKKLLDARRYIGIVISKLRSIYWYRHRASVSAKTHQHSRYFLCK